MNVLIAVDSFKGSLSTKELSKVIRQGISKVSDTFIVKQIPIADGGEGTYETLVEGLGGKKIKIKVRDPLFQTIEAEYGLLQDKTAIIEMATSSGLTLVPEEQRNPLYTTTFGVGEMIKDAIEKGARSFIIGIGGSATNDGGIGMLNALGYEFKDKEGNTLVPVGESLSKIEEIDQTNVLKELKDCTFLIACDVDNPFYGERGAAYVYGPQKGASKETVKQLDDGLRHFSEIIKKRLDVDISLLSGAGAAGGLGGGFKAFLNGELRPGIDIIFEKLGMQEYIDWADLVITGEGKMDFQTVMGKAPIGVAKLAKQKNIPVIAIAGSIADEAELAHEQGITSMFSITDGPISLNEAMNPSTAKRLLEKQIVEIFRLIHRVHNM